MEATIERTDRQAVSDPEKRRLLRKWEKGLIEEQQRIHEAEVTGGTWTDQQRRKLRLIEIAAARQAVAEELRSLQAQA